MKSNRRNGRVLLGVLLFAAPVVASAAFNDIDFALSWPQHGIGTSNIASVVAADSQIQLELARRQRQARDFEQASKTLVSILNANPLDEIKRSSLLELALTAQQSGQTMRAIQIFAQYLERYPQDPNVPEVMLRQAFLYRQMGAYNMAISKFYAVMTAILNMKLDSNGYYQRLVLQAQTEIADTWYLQGNFVEAVDFYNRLLKLDSAALNKAQIRLKLIRSLSACGRHKEVVREAQELLMSNPKEAEVRFLLAVSLQHLGHKQEALRQVLLLLELPEGQAWKQSVGNQIGNTLYVQGDYSNALVVYRQLGQTDPSPEWQIPIFYQIGLIHERLQQPQQAIAAYTQAAELGSKLGKPADPSLQVVLDMSQWRKNYLAWQSQTPPISQAISSLLAPTAPH